MAPSRSTVTPGVVWTQIASAICTASREVAPGNGWRDPVVVNERRAVEELSIELCAIHSRERQPVHPGAVGMSGDRGRLLVARYLGLTRQPRVGGRKAGHIDFARAGIASSQREPDAASRVLHLGGRQRAEQ